MELQIQEPKFFTLSRNSLTFQIALSIAPIKLSFICFQTFQNHSQTELKTLIKLSNKPLKYSTLQPKSVFTTFVAVSQTPTRIFFRPSHAPSRSPLKSLKITSNA
jgi:hypothetical protein